MVNQEQVLEILHAVGEKITEEKLFVQFSETVKVLCAIDKCVAVCGVDTIDSSKEVW